MMDLKHDGGGEWVRCPLCSRRFFKMGPGSKMSIQIKCPSCKAIVDISTIDGVSVKEAKKL